MLESAKALLNQAFTQYAGVLCGQPFEIAKLVLQVRRVDGGVLTGEKEGGRDRRWGGGREGYDEVGWGLSRWSREMLIMRTV